MFVSLNKKFIYSIVIFFIFTGLLFIYTFYLAYGKKMEEEQQSTLTRNQQYLELLIENINLRRNLRSILSQEPDLRKYAEISETFFSKNAEENKLTEWSRQKKQIDETIKTYDKRYAALREGFQIIAYSSILMAASILLFWWLLRRWVLVPIKRLADAGNEVATGNISIRIAQPSRVTMPDELDNLTATFNHMLENLEQNIIEIKSAENFLQSLIDSIPDGIRVIDEDYNIIMANLAYLNQIGQKSDINQKCYACSQNLNKPCPHTLMTCPIYEICHNHKDKVRVIQQFQNQPEKHLAISAAPLRFTDKDGKKRFYIVEAIRDLSDDIEFSRQQKLSSLGFLATSVAHEMKNNLGSIRLITEGLLEKLQNTDTLTDENKKYLEMAHNQIINTINIPERLLKLSHASAEQNSSLNCVDNIKEVMSLLDYEAKRRGININLNFEAADISILAEEADFRMLMLNLMLNALKAMPEGGELEVSLSQRGKNVTIDVKDTGIGIAKNKLNRIFEPFFSEGQNDMNKGTGLGLPIVKSIVNKFNGTIKVKSKLGQGTTFTVKFPKTK